MAYVDTTLTLETLHTINSQEKDCDTEVDTLTAWVTTAQPTYVLCTVFHNDILRLMRLMQ